MIEWKKEIVKEIKYRDKRNKIKFVMAEKKVFRQILGLWVSKKDTT